MPAITSPSSPFTPSPIGTRRRPYPAHASELIDRLGLEDPGADGRMIANRGCGDDLGRDQVLIAMRAHLAISPAGDEGAVLRTHVIAGLAHQATQNDGATAASGSAGLPRWKGRTPAECSPQP